LVIHRIFRKFCSAGLLKAAGFSVVSYKLMGRKAIRPDESELGKIAAKCGITIHFCGCCAIAEKK
jgi:hypothetical protein